MKTPRPQKQVKALFLSFTAASVLVAAPMIVMGCSSSNTAPFTAVVAGPTALTLTVAPASLTAVGQTATFTFTLNNATPTALEIPFTITLTDTSTTTFDPALPAEGTVTIPAGETTATFEATVATLPELDTTTTVTLTVPAMTLGGATASFTVVGPAAPPPVTSLPLAAPIPPGTAIVGNAIFVVGSPAPAGLTRITTTPESANFNLDNSINVPGFSVYTPGTALGNFPNVTNLEFFNVAVPVAVPADTCAYIAPINTEDPAASAIAKTATCRS